MNGNLDRRSLLASGLAALTMSNAHAADDLVAAKERLLKLKPKDFPSQPLDLVVAYPAGGGQDLAGRRVARYLEKYIDNRVNISNRTGGAGVIGHTWLATQAPNDGHTLGFMASAVWSDGMRSNGRWSHRDLEPIAFVVNDPVQLLTAPNGPLKGMKLKEVVELAKQKPGTIKVAVVPGIMMENCVIQLENVTGAKFVRVPFQGGALGVTAALGGHVDACAAFYSEYQQHLGNGSITPVGVADEQRLPIIPNVPTIKEEVGQNVIWYNWRYVAAPKGLAADRREYLMAAFDATLSDPELVEDLRKSGSVVRRDLKTQPALEAEIERIFGIEKLFYESRK